MTLTKLSDCLLRFPTRHVAMLDRDVAEVFGVETRVLNQAANRHPERFLEGEMRFQLSEEEVITLRDHRPDALSNRSDLRPWAYTQVGCNMLAVVLRSPQAVERSIEIIRAFTALEQKQSPQLALLKQMHEILGKALDTMEDHENRLQALEHRVRALEPPSPSLHVLPPATTNPVVATSKETYAGVSCKEFAKMVGAYTPKAKIPHAQYIAALLRHSSMLDSVYAYQRKNEIRVYAKPALQHLQERYGLYPAQWPTLFDTAEGKERFSVLLTEPNNVQKPWTLFYVATDRYDVRPAGDPEDVAYISRPSTKQHFLVYRVDARYVAAWAITQADAVDRVQKYLEATEPTFDTLLRFDDFYAPSSSLHV